jgi:hypothetical protein
MPIPADIPNARDEDKVWFSDGRPFIGAINIEGQGIAAPTLVSGTANVYRYPSSDRADGYSLNTYKLQPMIAYCGLNLLREGTQISDETPYTYCVATNGGDCGQPGSRPGDAFVSCPRVRNPAGSCVYPGIALGSPETRDPCLVLSAQYTMTLSQVGFATQTKGLLAPLPENKRSHSGRVLTRGFGRYKSIDYFWNPKTTPDGKVLLFRASFLNGYSTQVLMAPLPPFPDITKDTLDRGNFIPVPVSLEGPGGTVSAKVRFGYGPDFYCMSRPEPCEARADLAAGGTAAPPYYFASEPPDVTAIDCTGGCPASINLPGISQRVMYYQPIYTDGSGVQTTGPLQVAVVP